jgi:hypothetical protein
MSSGMDNCPEMDKCPEKVKCLVKKIFSKIVVEKVYRSLPILN